MSQGPAGIFTCVHLNCMTRKKIYNSDASESEYVLKEDAELNSFVLATEENILSQFATEHIMNTQGQSGNSLTENGTSSASLLFDTYLLGQHSVLQC